MSITTLPISGNDADAFRMHTLLDHRQAQIAAEVERGNVDHYQAAALQLAAANMRHNHASAHAAHWH